MPIADLEAQLNDFNPAVRARALAELVALAKRGDVPCEPERDAANMHCHTFFSFNAYGYSPTALAWLAKQRGFRLMGIVDFDVLDGVEEFLAACDTVEVRGSAGIETRVHIPEFATREINSPGGPGIFYHMGIGFTSRRVPEEVAPILAALRGRAARRNRSIIARVNEYLAPVRIDYEQDVLPLTPGGNPTERHIVAAYMHAVERTLSDVTGFWATKDLTREQMANICVGPFWTARTLSTDTQWCSAPWGWATRARGHRHTCPPAASATRSTPRWDDSCRRGRPGWCGCGDWGRM